MRLLRSAASAFDRAAIFAARARNRTARAESLSHAERLQALEQIRDVYGPVGSPDDFFTPPEPIDPALMLVREKKHFTVYDASWPSHFEPFLPNLRERYLAHVANRTARARLYLGKERRPAIVLIHGYLAGQWAIEERAWPIAWLAERYDLALALLPFHALRSSRDKRGPPPFPGSDPRMTNEGFRQSIFDLRALSRFLIARGAPRVGVMGMSLGGYTTALFATVEPNLAFAVPIIPLASLADWAREQGRLGDHEQARLQHAALEEANRIVSPFSRPSLVPPSRVLVVAATGDRITPIAHAERLANHFGASIVRFEGGHILQFGRGDAFRAIGRWLGQIA
jgi:pimeloyl-ACP methyl ester carboxylesterase